jgi:hypothetical protein
MIGTGYVEFRHLDSFAFFRSPARAVPLATRCAGLLAALPRTRMQSRMQDVVACARRLRELGGLSLAEAASAAGRLLSPENGISGENQDADRLLLAEVLRTVQRDKDLLRRFPWAAGFPGWRAARGRDRNALRCPYAVRASGWADVL